jgi:hypothetical protein
LFYNSPASSRRVPPKVHFTTRELAIRELAIRELAIRELAIRELAIRELAIRELAIHSRTRSSAHEPAGHNPSRSVTNSPQLPRPPLRHNLLDDFDFMMRLFIQ